MLKNSVTSKREQLRLTAEARLKGGLAPKFLGGSSSIESLRSLHSLAGDPAKVSDALKLLHELQVHQVELDLQHEQMDEDRRELTEDLHRYVGLFDFAPVGYFTMDLEGKIIEGNLAGADLFGLERDGLSGRRLEDFLAPASRPVLLELMQRVRHSGSRQTCLLQSGVEGVASTSRRLQVVAGLAPEGRSLLMTLMDTTDLMTEDAAKRL
jgi:PAS domain-containing protein